MYVSDQYAERAFYELFGFERIYEGDGFPGFLAVGNGSAVIGLQQASAAQPAYSGGLRWQFEVDSTADLDEIITVCRTHQLEHDVIVEEGGERFRQRCVTVRSPAGIVVWFEGPNEPQPPAANETAPLPPTTSGLPGPFTDHFARSIRRNVPRRLPIRRPHSIVQGLAAHHGLGARSSSWLRRR